MVPFEALNVKLEHASLTVDFAFPNAQIAMTGKEMITIFGRGANGGE